MGHMLSVYSVSGGGNFYYLVKIMFPNCFQPEVSSFVFEACKLMSN